MNKRFLTLIMIVMVIPVSLFSGSPTMILDLGANSLLYPDNETLFIDDWFLNTGTLFSYRGKIFDIGYYSLFSSISAGFTYTDPYIYSDEEMISLETGIYFKNSKIIFTAGFDSSVTGTYMTIPYYCPEWELIYYFVTERKKVQPFLSYQGYYSIEPESEEDIFYQGTEFGINHRPTITDEYMISLGIGWEHWPEYPVYSPSGAHSDSIRNDVICTANGKLKGIFHFFLDWEIKLSVSMLWSNANNYIKEIDFFNEKSEDCIIINFETNFEWSPLRYIHVKFHPYFTPRFYSNKQALTTDGTLKGEYARAYTAGGNFHIDWTPDNYLYILFETEGMAYFSNHMDQFNWNTLFHLGLEYSLKF